MIGRPAAQVKQLLKDVKSKFTGVYFYPYAKESLSWHSVVSVDGKRVSCGYFSTEKEAALARDRAIIRYGLKQPLQILKKA